MSAHTRIPRRLAGLVVCAATMAVTRAANAQRYHAPSCSSAADAISYKELPEGGPAADTGRLLTTNGDARWAVDVNSRIDVRVDTLCLRRMLAPSVTPANYASRAAALGTRLAHLDDAARAIPGLIQRWQDALEAYRTDTNSRAPRAQAAVLAYDAQAGLVTGALHEAIAERLVDEQTPSATASTVSSREAAVKAVSRQASAVMSPIYRQSGYDADALRALMAREIASVRAAMDALPAPALAMSVRAYLRTRGGDAVPIYLVHYNSAAVGPDVPVTKVEMAVSPDQAAMFASYQKMAASMTQAKSAGQAAAELVRMQYEGVRSALDTTTGAVSAALTATQTQLKTLDRWRSADERAQWLTRVARTIGQLPEVSARWNTVSATIDTMARDVELIRNIAALRPRLATDDPATALTDILAAAGAVSGITREERAALPFLASTWTARIARIEALTSAVTASGDAQAELLRAPSPLADLAQLQATATTLGKTLEAVPAAGREWLAAALGANVAQAASELPDPPGQRRQALGADAGTTIDLRTIPVKRNEGDRVEVIYDFYSNDAPVAGGWHDELSLRSFGWLARSVAGIGFVRQHHTSEGAWSPTATLSWLATYRPWPGGSQSGLGGITRSWGVGISTMSVNFDSAQKVQLGLGLTVSLLDDRLLAGYGYDLQANENPGFLFFSVRLFSATGGLGAQ